MAKTIKELMADAGLDVAPPAGQTKVASADAASSAEVNQVLENLGVSTTAEAVVKTASEQPNGKDGKSMQSMEALYGQIFGDTPTASETEKTAAAAAAAGGEGGAAAAVATQTQAEAGDAEKLADAHRTAFGETVAGYFNEIAGAYGEKLAGDLEAEAGKGELPLEHIQPSGGMTSVLGKPSDPALPQNHSGSSAEKIHATTKGTTPYSLKGPAMKEVLKRLSAAQPGGSFEQ